MNDDLIRDIVSANVNTRIMWAIGRDKLTPKYLWEIFSQEIRASKKNLGASDELVCSMFDTAIQTLKAT